MGGQTVMIVPSTVPSATVLRMQRAEPEGPIVISAEPAVVPAARAVLVVSEEITPEQVAQLRRENDELRQQLASVRAS